MFDNTENLIHVALNLIKQSPELLDENVFIDDLKELNLIIENDELPFIDDEETIFAILTYV